MAWSASSGCFVGRLGGWDRATGKPLSGGGVMVHISVQILDLLFCVLWLELEVEPENILFLKPEIYCVKPFPSTDVVSAEETLTPSSCS